MEHQRPFRTFYRRYMNALATLAPKWAVGGLWKEIGELELNFLLGHGLKPEHTLLDIGCGALRGGIRFIAYLDTHHYYGLDISEKMIEAGTRAIAQEHLQHKAPTLLVTRDLTFVELERVKFDYILAWSVFTHIPIIDVEECFQHIHKVMTEGSIFFATILDGGHSAFRLGPLPTFYYPFSTFQALGEKFGYHVELIKNFPHPRKQKMMKITRKEPR